LQNRAEFQDLAAAAAAGDHLAFQDAVPGISWFVEFIAPLAAGGQQRVKSVVHTRCSGIAFLTRIFLGSTQPHLVERPRSLGLISGNNVAGLVQLLAINVGNILNKTWVMETGKYIIG
jgi:hypothetical protein